MTDGGRVSNKVGLCLEQCDTGNVCYHLNEPNLFSFPKLVVPTQFP